VNLPVNVRVLVVEDEEVAAEAHATYVGRVPGFELADRGDGQHVAGCAAGPEPPQQLEPVSVGQVHVEQDQVDVRIGRDGGEGLATGSSHRSHGEVRHPSDVGGVGLRGHRLVLDHQHPEGHPTRPAPLGVGSASRASTAGIVTVNAAPPRGLELTSIRPA